MSDVGTKVAGLKFMLAGIVVIALGVTQAIYGWVGTGMFYRILYPAVCIPMGLLVGTIGFLAFMVKDEDEPTSDTAQEPSPGSQPARSLSSNAQPPEAAASTTSRGTTQILAVVVLLGIVGLRFVPLLIKHSEQQQQIPKNSGVQQFTNQLNERGQGLGRLVGKMNAAGISAAKQDQFFRDQLAPSQKDLAKEGGLQILTGDWKLLVAWDFETLEPKVDAFIESQSGEPASAD